MGKKCIMPDEHYVDACNAIREQGVPGTVLSGEMGEKIRKISNGIKLEKIEITNPPDKITYKPTERFDPTGMVVQATYSNGAKLIATGYSWTPDGALAEGTSEINITYTEAGKSVTTQQIIKVEREVIQLPSQSNTLTYTGNTQTPTWSGYDINKMSISGQTSGIDAGIYQAIFTPSIQYKWPDGSTTGKNVNWNINKASGKVTLSPNKVTLDASHKTATISIDCLGDGNITASGGGDLVSTSISGTILTITSIDNKTGNVDITVQVSSSKNYNAASAICNVKAAFLSIYGAEWDGTASTKWARTDMAAGFVDPTPAINNGSGSSPFDDKMPWAGMKRVSDPQAGELVEIPKYWFKWTKSGNRLKLQIADGPAPGFHVSPGHADRGDGKGERDKIYVGRYHCAGSGWKSQTGQKPHVNITRPASNSGVHTLGSTIWLMDWATRWTIELLYLVEFADWNSQKVIGKGCGDGSLGTMGYTDSMGYHTGTTKPNRDTGGLGTQYRWIEGLWDNCYDWVGGCYYNGNGLNVIMNPAQYSDSSGGTVIGIPVSGWSSKFDLSTKSGYEWCIWPIATGGSETTYLSDGWSFDSGGPCLCVGGYYSVYGHYGIFFVGYYGASGSNGNVGCRAMKLP